MSDNSNAGTYFYRTPDKRTAQVVTTTTPTKTTVTKTGPGGYTVKAPTVPATINRPVVTGPGGYGIKAPSSTPMGQQIDKYVQALAANKASKTAPILTVQPEVNQMVVTNQPKSSPQITVDPRLKENSILYMDPVSKIISTDETKGKPLYWTESANGKVLELGFDGDFEAKYSTNLKPILDYLTSYTRPSSISPAAGSISALLNPVKESTTTPKTGSVSTGEPQPTAWTEKGTMGTVYSAHEFEALNEIGTLKPGQYKIYMTDAEGQTRPIVLSNRPVTTFDKSNSFLQGFSEAVIQPASQAAKVNPVVDVIWSGFNAMVSGVANKLKLAAEVPVRSLSWIINAAKGGESWAGWMERQKEFFVDTIARTTKNSLQDIARAFNRFNPSVNLPKPTSSFESAAQNLGAGAFQSMDAQIFNAISGTESGIVGPGDLVKSSEDAVTLGKQEKANSDALAAEAKTLVDKVQTTPYGEQSESDLLRIRESITEMINSDEKRGYAAEKLSPLSVNPWFAFDWQRRPEAYEAFKNACVETAIQKMAIGQDPHLTENELANLKGAFADPIVEMVGSAATDVSNVIPFELVFEGITTSIKSAKSARQLAEYSRVSMELADEWISTGKMVGSAPGLRAADFQVEVQRRLFDLMPEGKQWMLQQAARSKSLSIQAGAGDVAKHLAQASGTADDFLSSVEDISDFANAVIKNDPKASDLVLNLPVNIRGRQQAWLSELAKVIEPNKWGELAENAKTFVTETFFKQYLSEEIDIAKKLGDDVTVPEVLDAIKAKAASRSQAAVTPKAVSQVFADYFRKKFIADSQVFWNSNILNDGWFSSLVKVFPELKTNKLGKIIAGVNNIQNAIMGGWFNAVLSLRPAWVIRNFQDNVARFMVAGGTWGGDLGTMVKELGYIPDDLTQSMRMLPDSNPSSLAFRQEQGWKPSTLLDFYKWQAKNLWSKGPTLTLETGNWKKVLGSLLRDAKELLDTSIGNSFKLLSRGTADWNNFVEDTFRIRLYYTKYTENVAALRNILDPQLLGDLPKEFQPMAKALLDKAKNNPLKLKDLAQLKDATLFSHYLPEEVLQAYGKVSPVDQANFFNPIRRQLEDFVVSIRKNYDRVPTTQEIVGFYDGIMKQIDDFHTASKAMHGQMLENMNLDMAARNAEGATLDEAGDAVRLPDQEALDFRTKMGEVGSVPDESEASRILKANGIKEIEGESPVTTLRNWVDGTQPKGPKIIEPEAPPMNVTVASFESDITQDEDLLKNMEIGKQWGPDYQATLKAKMNSQIEFTGDYRIKRDALPLDTQKYLTDMQLDLVEASNRTRVALIQKFPWPDADPNFRPQLWENFEQYYTAARNAQNEVLKHMMDTLKEGKVPTKKFDWVEYYKTAGIEFEFNSADNISSIKFTLPDKYGQLPRPVNRPLVLNEFRSALRGRSSGDIPDKEALGMLNRLTDRDTEKFLQMAGGMPKPVKVKASVALADPEINKLLTGDAPIGKWDNYKNFIDPYKTPLKDTKYAIISAENPGWKWDDASEEWIKLSTLSPEENAARTAKLQKELQDRGLEFIGPLESKYGSDEHSFIVIGMNKTDAMDLGTLDGMTQDSVIVQDGMIFLTKDEVLLPSWERGIDFDPTKSDYFTKITIGGQEVKFTLPYDFDNGKFVTFNEYIGTPDYEAVVKKIAHKYDVPGQMHPLGGTDGPALSKAIRQYMRDNFRNKISFKGSKDFDLKGTLQIMEEAGFIGNAENFTALITDAFNAKSEQTVFKLVPDLAKDLKAGIRTAFTEAGLLPADIDLQMEYMEYLAKDWAETNGKTADEFWLYNLAGVKDSRISLSGKLLYNEVGKPVWYSPLSDTIQKGLRNGSYPDGQSALAALRGLPGIKKEELEISGVEDWLGSITKQDLIDGIEMPDGRIIHKLTPEEIDNFRSLNEVYIQEVWHGDLEGGTGFNSFGTKWGQNVTSQYNLPTTNPGSDFEWLMTLPSEDRFEVGVHWDELNPVAHVRGSVVSFPEGNTGLLLQEVQSDIHEQARDSVKRMRWDLYKKYGDKDNLVKKLKIGFGESRFKQAGLKAVEDAAGDLNLKLKFEEQGLGDVLDMAKTYFSDVIKDLQTLSSQSEIGRMSLVDTVFNAWYGQNSMAYSGVVNKVEDLLNEFFDAFDSNLKKDLQSQLDTINNMVIPDISSPEFKPWIESVATPDELAVLRSGGYRAPVNKYFKAKFDSTYSSWKDKFKDADFSVIPNWDDHKFVLENPDVPFMDKYDRIKEANTDVLVEMRNMRQGPSSEFNQDLMDSMADASNALDELEASLKMEGPKDNVFDRLLPDYPFKKNYTELGLKRMFRKAADDGHDFFMWTTGDQQVQRYGDITLHWEKDQSGTFNLYIDQSNGALRPFGQVTNFQDVRGLPGEAGSSWAESIWKQMQKSERGSYKPMEEGMRNYYDKEMVDYVNKVGKKFGVQVEDVKYSTGGIKIVHSDRGNWIIQNMDTGELVPVNGIWSWGNERDVTRAFKHLPQSSVANEISVHGIRMTDEMKAWAAEPKPLFMQGKDGIKRAATYFDKEGRATIVNFIKNGMTPLDAVHELTHVYIPQIKAKDWNVLSPWLESLPGDKAVKITGDEFMAMHREKWVTKDITPEREAIYIKTQEAIDDGIVTTIVNGELPVSDPTLKSFFKKLATSIKKWYNKWIKGTSRELQVTPEVRRVFASWFEKSAEEIPQVVKETEDMAEAWKAVLKSDELEKWGPEMDLTSPNTAIDSLNQMIERTTDPTDKSSLIQIRNNLQDKMEMIEHSIDKMQGVPTKTKKRVAPIPVAKLPVEYQNWYAFMQNDLQQMARSRQALLKWRDFLIDSFDKAAAGDSSAQFFMYQSDDFWKSIGEWANRSAGKIADMEDVAIHGGTLNGVTVDGALNQTNDSMLDYTYYRKWENIMRTIYPFWMFPSRSTVFWAKTLTEHPQIASWYQKYMLMSERLQYQEGLVTSQGEPLASYTGYVKIPGTNIWVNPTAALSFRYVLNPIMGISSKLGNVSTTDASGEEISPFLSAVREFYAVGQDFGFTLNPFLTMLPQVKELTGQTEAPSQTLVPLLDLIPLSWRKSVINSLGLMQNPTFKDAVASEVPWKDYLVESAALKDANMKILSAKNDITQWEIANKYKAMLADPNRDTNPLWIEYLRKVENTERYQKTVAYFTGVYGKPYTDADALFLDLRDEVNLMRDTINNNVGADLFELAPDAMQRSQDRIDRVYNDPQGAIYNLAQAIRYVVDDSDKEITDQSERRKAIISRINTDTLNESYYAQKKQLRETRDAKKAALPLGTPSEITDPIDQEYYQGMADLESNPLYANVETINWSPVNKSEEAMMDHFRWQWNQDLRSTLAPYDPDRETLAEYYARKSAWEADLGHQADLLAKTFKTQIEKEMVSVFPDMFWGQYLKTRTSEDDLGLSQRIIDQLKSETTVQGIRDFYKKSDSIEDALNNAWYALYYSKYLEAVDGLSGDKRTQAENRFFYDYPSSYLTPKMLADYINSDPVYARNKWTEDQIIKKYLGMGALTVTERQDQSKTEAENQTSKIFDLYGWLDVGTERSEFLKTFKSIGGNEDDLTLLFNDSEFFNLPKNSVRANDFYNKVSQAIGLMGVKPPTAEELIPRIQAKEENDLLQAKTKELFGENIYVQRATYYSLSYAEQKAFRASQPDVWAAIDASNKFKDNFAEMYPVWASFYTSQTKTTSGTSAYGGSTSGGTSATKKTSSTGTGKTTLVFPDGSIDLDYPLRGDFLKMGKRSTIYVNQLLSGVKIGTGGTAGLPKWPPELMEVLGGLMVQEFINSLRSQAPLSAAALKYLRSIKNNHPEWAQFLDEMEALTASSTKETVT